MKKAALLVITLAALLFVSSSCAIPSHGHHLYNPLHWGHHAAKIFDPKDGELHLLHIDLDRVVFGLDNYDEFERTESNRTSK